LAPFQRRSVLNEVTQVFQLDREVHVVDHDSSERRARWGEIQNTGDAVLHERVGHFLGDGGGTVRIAIFTRAVEQAGKFLHAENRLGMRLSAGVWVHVEPRDDSILPFRNRDTTGAPGQDADTHEDDRLQLVVPSSSEIFLESSRRRSRGRACELRNRRDPCAIGWLHAGHLRQRFAGHGLDAVLLEPRQAAQVNGETINRLARNFGAVGFFQA